MPELVKEGLFKEAKTDDEKVVAQQQFEAAMEMGKFDPAPYDGDAGLPFASD